MRYLALAVAMLLCFSVIAMAVGSAPPQSVVENGDTYLRTFILNGLPDHVVTYFKECMTSQKNGIVYSLPSSGPGGYYCFFTYQEKLNLVATATSQLDIEIASSFLVRVLRFERQGDRFIFVDDVRTHVIEDVSLIVGGRYWDGYSYPSFATDYIAKYQGNLYIETDDGTTSDGGEDNSGIAGWLTNFWNKFIEVLGQLFIPSPDYFPNFFEDLKTAFEERLGGLGDLLASVSTMFASLQNVSKESTLVISVPDNQFYAGYKGLTVDAFKYIRPMITFIRGVINAFLVVVTIIICYKKLVSIIKT